MSLHFRDEGQGEVAVLVHGLGASHRVFDGVIAAGGRRYVAIDLPRSGKSLRWAESHPVEIAKALSAWLAARKIERYHLVGHSFGGLVALSLAAAAPERVHSLTVASAPALGLPAETRALLSSGLVSMSAQWAARVPVPRVVMAQYLRWMSGGRAASAQSLALHLESSKNEGYFPGMVDALQSISAYQLPTDALRAARFRTRVLWGEVDPLVPVLQGERLALALGAELQVLPGVGHCLPEQHPEAIVDALTAQIGPR